MAFKIWILRHHGKMMGIYREEELSKLTTELAALESGTHAEVTVSVVDEKRYDELIHLVGVSVW